jgi:hypothetical protein
MTAPVFLAIFAAAAGLAAAILIYYAGGGVPPKMQTWKGTAPHELEHEGRQAMLRRWGMAAAVMATVAAISAAVFGLP